MDFGDRVFKNLSKIVGGEVKRTLPELSTPEPIVVPKRDSIISAIDERATANNVILNKKYNLLEQLESEQNIFIKKKLEEYEEELKQVEVIKDKKEEWSFNYIPDQESSCYNKLNSYRYDHNFNTDLPIYMHRDKILKAIESNNIIIIEGSTGCGKTTQVPQYILDFNATQNRYCNILVTQPRRIAAISIGYRVCEERSWKLGEYCGYQVGMDKTHVSKYTRISYVTIGILMKKLITQSTDLNKYTHIIIDEVHDRELNTDIGLLILKLLKLGPNFNWKLILMSATLDSQKFADYYQINNFNRPIPVIKCELKIHHVDVFYLDDLIEKFKLSPIEFRHSEKCELKEELKQFLGKLLRYFDEIDGVDNRGSVLIFVPGMDEIIDLDAYIRQELSDLNIIIRPLHSDISFEQQKKAWWKTSEGVRKVILSTSIAESSITIQDIKYVIDFCLTREQTSDDETNYLSLQTQWASKSTMDQRKGRTGRVSNGRCYRMILKDFFDTLGNHKQPEILKLSLEKCILDLKLFSQATKDTIKFCKQAEPKKLLSLALDVPPFYDIERSVANLKEDGALSLFDGKKENINPSDGELTFVGKVMALLPIDIKLTKLILIGHVFGKLRECIVLAAALTQKSIFLKTVKSSFETYKWKFYYASGTFCDFTSIINAFNVYEHKVMSFDNELDKQQWCLSQYLDFTQLCKVKQLKQEIEQRLAELYLVSNILEFDESNKRNLVNEDQNRLLKKTSQNDYILKFIIAGAFYPNYFFVETANETIANRTVNYRDPRKSVYIRGKGLDVVYNEKLLEIFKNTCESDLSTVYLDNKAIVEFSNSKLSMSNSNLVSSRRFIEPGVYLALALGKIYNSRFELNRVLNANEIQTAIEDLKRQSKHSIYKPINTTTNALLEIHSLNDPHEIICKKLKFKIEITDVIEFGHFRAFIKNDGQFDLKLKEIQDKLKILHANNQLKLIERQNLRLGQLVCTHFMDYSTFEIAPYRAKIICISDMGVDVLYVDYGNKLRVDFGCIFELPHELLTKKFMSFECKLAHVRLKRDDIKDKFENLVYRENAKFEIEIYSIVDCVARVRLFDTTNHPLCVKDLNEFFVHELEYAEKFEESEISKRENERLAERDLIQCSSMSRKHDNWLEQDKLSRILSRVKYSHEDTIELKGPDSDLRVQARPITYLNTRINYNLKAKPNRDSINYVLLDDQPENQCDRLLVAANVNKTDGKIISLRNTCLLPKVRGFAALTTLVFTPTMTLRFDKHLQVYTGALCGLGCTNDGQAINQDNDIELVFDFKFTNSDLKSINAIRALMNMLIGDGKLTKQWMSESEKTREALIKLQARAIQFTENLLESEREALEPTYFNKEYVWNADASNRFLDDPHFKEKGLLYRTHKHVLNST